MKEANEEKLIETAGINKASATIDARGFSSVETIPGTITPTFNIPAPIFDLFTFYISTATSTEPFIVPAARQHCIVSIAGSSATMEGNVGGLHGKDVATPGGYRGFSIVPAEYPGKWRVWEGRPCSKLLYFSAELLVRDAIQVFDISPTHASLDPKVGFEDPSLYEVFLAIRQVLWQPGLFDLLYLESLSHTLAAHLIRLYVSSPAVVKPVKGKLPKPVLKRVLDCIESRPGADLTLAGLAEVARLSPYHFARMFKETTGQTVHGYVLEQRLTRSLHLLRDGDATIAQIAAEAGFADQSHLVRQFKKTFGVTPAELRKNRKIVQDKSPLPP